MRMAVWTRRTAVPRMGDTATRTGFTSESGAPEADHRARWSLACL